MPTNQILTREQFNALMQSFAVAITGLDPDNGVKIAWPQDGAPGWAIGADQVFIRAYFDPDSYTQQRDTDYGEDVGDGINQQVKVSYIRVHAVDFKVYGPNAEENAETLRNGFYDDTITDSLAVSNLAFILDPYVVVWEPELFNGQWWSVGNLHLRFNEEVKLYSQVPYLSGVEIIIETDNGVEEIILL